MARTFVFAGPTLSRKQILSIVPDVEVLPPVASGDLLRLPLAAGDLVAIIDGFYFQSAAVRHKEILFLLSQGIHVWGAASMGALRAAELAPFGMRGSGHVFDEYQRGTIEGDDEVAILHSPKDMGYTPLSEALVNIRYACQAAYKAQIISASTCTSLIEHAAALPFYERSYPRLLSEITENNEEILRFLQQENLNIKRLDALEMLRDLQNFHQEPFLANFTFHETVFFKGWKVQESRTPVGKNRAISDLDLLTAAQLFAQDYPDVHANLLLRLLAQSAPSPVSTEKPEQPVSAERFIVPVAHYMATHYRFSLDQPLPSSARTWLRSHELELPLPHQLALLAVRLWHGSRKVEWQAAMLLFLKSSPLLPELSHFVLQVHTVNQQIKREQKMLEEAVPRQEMIEWFYQRWNAAPQENMAERDLTLLDRGFDNFSDFTWRALPFYLLDKYHGIKPLNLRIASPDAF